MSLNSMLIGPNDAYINSYIASILAQSVFFYDPFDGASFGGTPADNTPIASFNEKYGRTAWNLTQGTAANQPLYKSNSGKSYLLFDGVNDTLSTASVNSAPYFSASELTAILVCFFSGTADASEKVVTGYLGSTDASRLISVSILGTSNNFSVNSGGKQTSISSVFSTFKVLTLVRSIGTNKKKISVNGTIEGIPQSANAVVTSSGPLTLGSFNNSLFFKGGIGEFIIFNSVLPDTQINLISRYFMKRRGL